MPRRYALRDDQWNRIKDLLPGRKQTVGVTTKDNRLFVEAVLYRYQAGIPWHILHRVAHHMHNTELNLCLGIHSLNRIRKTLQAIHTGNEDIFNATRL